MGINTSLEHFLISITFLSLNLPSIQLHVLSTDNKSINWLLPVKKTKNIKQSLIVINIHFPFYTCHIIKTLVVI